MRAKLDRDNPPRYWKVTIARLTGLNFCDRNCGCGENSQLWYFPTPSGEVPIGCRDG